MKKAKHTLVAMFNIAISLIEQVNSQHPYIYWALHV